MKRSGLRPAVSSFAICPSVFIPLFSQWEEQQTRRRFTSKKELRQRLEYWVVGKIKFVDQEWNKQSYIRATNDICT